VLFFGWAALAAQSRSRAACATDCEKTEPFGGLYSNMPFEGGKGIARPALQARKWRRLLMTSLGSNGRPNLNACGAHRLTAFVTDAQPDDGSMKQADKSPQGVAARGWVF
jgi:hypothetical protein